MDIGSVIGIATATGALAVAFTRIYGARSEKNVNQAGAAQQLAEATSALLQPLNSEIERLNRDVATCNRERRELSEKVAGLEGQVEVLRSTQAHVAAGTSESLLASMLAAAPDGLVLVNKWGTIEFANRTAERMFGYAEGGIAGIAVKELVPERFRERHRQHTEHFMANPKARPMGVGRQLSGRRFDGSEFPVEIGLAPMRRVGEEEKVIAVVRDMTERSQA